MKTAKRQKKIVVKLHGHEWSVYPLKSRDSTIYRVFHRVNGQRVPKTFMSLAKKPRPTPRALLKEFYGKADSRIHLTDDEKRDWRAAMNLMKEAQNS